MGAIKKYIRPESETVKVNFKYRISEGMSEPSVQLGDPDETVPPGTDNPYSGSFD